MENASHFDDDDHEDSSSSRSDKEEDGDDDGDDDLDVDSADPLIFEFPFYVSTMKRNMVMMREQFLRENRVGALKIAIQVQMHCILALCLCMQ